MLNRRVKGYLISGGVGLALGIFVDAIDVQVLLQKRDKALLVLGASALVVGSVAAAFNEPGFGGSDVPNPGSEEIRSSGSSPGP
jgi:hypothetical protein